MTVAASILQSVEFYVIAAVVAASVVALASRGKPTGPARQYLLPGVLSREDTGNFSQGDTGSGPTVTLTCNDDGSVTLKRRGIDGLEDTGAVSLAIDKVGFDVKITERRAAPRNGGERMDTATFSLDFMGAEYYFISYRTAEEGLFCALTLHNRPGISVTKALK